MIVYCEECGADIEVEEDNSLHNFCNECEEAIEMEKQTEDDRDPISRNFPFHNV